MQRLEDKVRGLSAQLANVQFSYRDPVRNFDRSKVKGVVAKLIKVKDRNSMTALEVTGYHIITQYALLYFNFLKSLCFLFSGYCWWEVV